MTKADMSDVLEEVTTNEQEVQDTQEVQEVQESDQDKNFRQLREANEKLRHKDEQRDQIIMSMQQQLLEQKKVPVAAQEPEYDEFADIDKSDWSTIEQVEKLSERVADRRFEKKWAEAEAKRDAAAAKRKKEEAPQRVKSKHKDFDSVVTKDTMKQLKSAEPDIFKALQMINDEETQAIAAYKYIKALIPDARQQSESQQRIQSNLNRPKSLSASGGASPLSQANAFEKGLTPDLKKRLLAEMNECARRS